MANKFEDILEECLERMLQGESLEQCLELYPEQAAELKPLLEVAAAARRAASVEPRPEFKAQARYQLNLMQAKKERPKRRFVLLGWQRGLVIALTCVLVILLIGGSTVAASANSTPDETLYPVKLATEQVQLALTRSDIGKAKLHLRFADRRAWEITQMAEKDNPEEVQELTERLENHLDKIKHLAQEEQARWQGQGKVGRSPELVKLGQLLRQNRDNLRLMFQEKEGKVPPRARQDLRHALDRLERDYGKALQATGESLAEADNSSPPLLSPNF